MIHTRIDSNPQVMFGKPVIRGTRITVELILRKLAGGKSIDGMLREHPRLMAEDVVAAASGESRGTNVFIAQKRPQNEE